MPKPGLESGDMLAPAIRDCVEPTDIDECTVTAAAVIALSLVVYVELVTVPRPFCKSGEKTATFCLYTSDCPSALVQYEYHRF
ncbi:hypothetical protein J6590_102475 [Homalodisca vitripennis]|nr:hypothetical protein J6590_034921 [Homalodisca vitripennis]KAG8308742.1 hypothetical protein J6590_102475 [Homalodisca vitripennis]